MYACIMQTEMEAPEENRLTQPYQLSMFPLMTFDEFEANLKVLELVNESRSMPFYSSLRVKHENTVQDLKQHLKFPDFRSYPLTINILL